MKNTEKKDAEESKEKDRKMQAIQLLRLKLNLYLTYVEKKKSGLIEVILKSLIQFLISLKEMIRNFMTKLDLIQTKLMNMRSRQRKATATPLLTRNLKKRVKDAPRNRRKPSASA